MSPTKLVFELTPQLQSILQREIEATGPRRLHPWLSSDTKIVNGREIYDSSMDLPDLDDQKAILAWLGLNEEATERALQDYRDHLAGNVPLEFGPVLVQLDTPEETLVYNLSEMFISGIAKEWGFDEAEDYEGYVNSAVEIGSKPEFALLCGLHPDLKVEDGEAEYWYRHPPRNYVEELVQSYAILLPRLWKQRANARQPEEAEKVSDQETETSKPDLPQEGAKSEHEDAKSDSPIEHEDKSPEQSTEPENTKPDRPAEQEDSVSKPSVNLVSAVTYNPPSSALAVN
ncbi:hypothetical protein GLAREA_02119 [Glarea lozoyensis ATCC 20868]|uniref:Uncharacterized protein n=1 Tax=Glarea lozoyensis (strain ATCC 20868 / MF5171) TaxID=1116229 RepID=S3CI94_GLAL2|nr:uncharacterized protein GLAREA_02119 [Glarea lozoyensis ATCC 20868]EPE26207.1 hypothetical protein GLAREA_02119 [Glarea lozoyensis ATCC 20868]